jgi:hypothetical protein
MDPLIRPDNFAEDVAAFLKAQEPTRNYWVAVWAVDLAYCYGNQWRTAVWTPSIGAAHVLNIKQILDPDSKDIRVALNKVRENVEKTVSKIAPRDIEPRIVPSGMYSPEDRDAAEVAAVIHQYVQGECGGLAKVRSASKGRVVIGDWFVKACLRYRGSTPVVDPLGAQQPATGSAPTTLMDRDVVWYDVFPGEITVDFSNPSADLQDHGIFVHSQIRSVDWVKTHFGKDIETKCTLSELLRTHETIHAITAGGIGVSPGMFGDSKEPAVVLHEVYMQDPSRPNEWPIFGVLADGLEGEQKNTQLQEIIRGPNPFRGLPFMHMRCYEVPGRLYGYGQVRVQINAQDILNHLYSQLLRYTTTICNMPWLTDASTLSNESRKQLQSNRWNRVIEVNLNTHPNAKMPELSRPPDIPQIIPTMMAQVTAGMRDSTFLSDVAFGRVSARGEAAEAIRERADLSDSVFKNIADDDEQRLPPFLKLTIDAAARHWTPLRLDQATDGQFSREQLMAFQQSDIISNLSIRIAPGTLMPKTPREQRDENDRALNLQLAAPENVRFNEWFKLGATPDLVEANAWEAETRDCELILRTAQQAPVYQGEAHLTRVRVIDMYMNVPSTRARYGEAVMALLYEHKLAHLQMQSEEDQMMAMLTTPAMPGGVMPPEEMAGAPEAPPEVNAPNEMTAAA